MTLFTLVAMLPVLSLAQAPDPLSMAWDLAKIVLGVCVPLSTGLLAWIVKLLRSTLKMQEKHERQLEGADGQPGVIQEVRRHTERLDAMDERHEQEDIDAEVERRIHPPRRRNDRPHGESA
jgi:hypothetical protein